MTLFYLSEAKHTEYKLIFSTAGASDDHRSMSHCLLLCLKKYLKCIQRKKEDSESFLAKTLTKRLG